MADINIDELINRSKIAFDEVIYKLTDNYSTKDKQEVYMQSRDRVGKILQELKKITIAYPDVEKAKIDEFINSSKKRYNDVITGCIATITTPGTCKLTSPLGSDELPMNSKKTLVYNTPSPEKAIEHMKLVNLNIGSEIKVVDGEFIPDDITNMIYIIDPYTKDSNIIITRFISQESATKFITDNFKIEKIKPLILIGTEAKVKMSMTIV